VVHRDPIRVKFEGQGHKSKFAVTGWKNSQQENIFGDAAADGNRAEAVTVTQFPHTASMRFPAMMCGKL